MRMKLDRMGDEIVIVVPKDIVRSLNLTEVKTIDVKLKDPSNQGIIRHSWEEDCMIEPEVSK